MLPPAWFCRPMPNFSAKAPSAFIIPDRAPHDWLLYNQAMTSPEKMNARQMLFRELVFGTLVYAVVLGFFADYTSLLYTKSYSTTFAVAIVMEILTYLTLLLKKYVASHFKGKPHPWSKVALVVGVWLVLFLSKFVFLWVIDILFGSYVDISGFVGLILIIVTMTIAKEGIDYIFTKLGE